MRGCSAPGGVKATRAERAAFMSVAYTMPASAFPASTAASVARAC